MSPRTYDAPIALRDALARPVAFLGKAVQTSNVVSLHRGHFRPQVVPVGSTTAWK